METKTGYILSEFSKDSRDGCVFTLCCKNEDEYFEVSLPHRGLYFFVQSDAALPQSGTWMRSASGLKSPSGIALDKIEFGSIGDYFSIKTSLKEQGVRLYESDIHPDDRFLMDAGLFRSVSAGGTWRTEDGISVSSDAVLAPAEYVPRFRTLSLDIETGTDGSIYCIGIDAKDGTTRFEAVLMRDEKDALGKGGRTVETADGGGQFQLYPYSSEPAMLQGFFALLEKIDPDIIIGWNVIGFDLQFIADRCARHSMPFAPGRGKRPGKIIIKRTGMATVDAPGRIVIDGPQSLRTGFHQFEDYRLDTVAQELLGEGKDISETGADKIAEIEHRFAEDKPALARYNVLDCELVTRIFETTGLIEQFSTRSLLTGLRMDRVNMSVAAFDFFMVPRYHSQGFASIDTEDVIPGGHAAGGYVFTSTPGLYDDVAVFDFLSLYPSIMRTFFIDPLSRMLSAENPAETPVGIRFSKSRHILPDHIAYLLETRKKAKAAGDSHLSQAVKILMNSYYGVMGTTGCRFYHPDLPTAITGTGQWVLRTTAGFFRDKGFNVLYGDTDSVFVQLGPSDPGEFKEKASAAASEATRYIGGLISEQYGVESRLELEFEKHYAKFFLTPMRGSQEGSRKRYAGLEAESGTIEFKGLESVRSDWTEAAKKFQAELYRRFFLGEEIPGWIKTFSKELREGKFDADLVYKRRLTKNALEYTTHVPPHVKAALMLDPEGKKRIRRVSYLMTADGPVPVELNPGRIDYGHYEEKQIKPIADTVLQFTGTDYDSIIEGQQLDLFS